eukprot:2734486-Ditylum_brightwellii.AAC.1
MDVKTPNKDDENETADMEGIDFEEDELVKVGLERIQEEQQEEKQEEEQEEEYDENESNDVLGLSCCWIK